MKSHVVALDLGGTWVKGTAIPREDAKDIDLIHPVRVPNPLHTSTSAGEFARAVADFCRELCGGYLPLAVVAATAGEVNAAGNGYLCAGHHLGVMGTTPWVDLLSRMLNCPVKLINDAEAFLLGVAARGILPATMDTGALVVGTGLGFAMVRQGRWWKPARRLLHFGSIATEGGDYDQWTSAVRASENNLLRGNGIDEKYADTIAGAVATAVNLFHLRMILLGGGIVDLTREAGIDLAASITKGVMSRLLPGVLPPEIVVIKEGNRAILEGVLALAAGEGVAEETRFQSDFAKLATEGNAGGAGIERLTPREIVARLLEEESRAAMRFPHQATILAEGADLIARSIRKGGRVVYVGAGTSGRLGALDAVEIPCTFGLAPDRFVAVIAGGISDAALTIEDQFEEDISSVPDLILLSLNEKDVVVGISASGTAFFVRSALAYAKTKGATTIVIHESELERPLAGLSIRLESGPEVVAGSTRLKAGTATKKALNVLSTTAMILLGKIRDNEMVDLHCCNAKLQKRAVRILIRLRNLSEEQAMALLIRHDFRLRDALDADMAGVQEVADKIRK